MAEFYSQDINSDSSGSDLESDSPLAPVAPPVRKWDQFRETPPEVDSHSAAANVWLHRMEKVILFLAYVLTFTFVLACGMISKGASLFMFAQLAVNRTKNLPFCNALATSAQKMVPDDTGDSEFEVNFQYNPADPDQGSIERIAWLWCIFFAFAFPQVYVFLRAVKQCMFKFVKLPRLSYFVFTFMMELCHVLGLAMLAFLIMPGLDSIRGLILSTGFALIPGFFQILGRFQLNDESNTRKERMKLLVDIPAWLVQISVAVFWTTLDYTNYANKSGSWATLENIKNPVYWYTWNVPVALVLVSCGWWETYIQDDSPIGFVNWMWKVKKDAVENSRSASYVVISLMKIVVFLWAMMLLPWLTGGINSPWQPYTNFTTSFSSHNYTVSVIMDSIQYSGGINFNDGTVSQIRYLLSLDDSLALVPVWILITQILASFLVYFISKFVSKVQLQGFGFSFPITCIIPLSMLLLLAGCGARANDRCFFDFKGEVPKHLFFTCPAIGEFTSYLWDEQVWIGIVWFFSYMWLTIHIWYPRTTRLARTEQIFSTPGYESLFLDQSLMLNRRKDGDALLTLEELEFEIGQEENLKDMYERFPTQDGSVKGSHSHKSSVKPSDKVTKIYACATMWHENKEEMMEMLKSVFRIDMDYSARRLAQKYFGIVDQDYYEWETHIFFDDCMKLGKNPEKEQVVNDFVKLLVKTMDEAASEAHCRKIRVKPCKKFPTPYGGRLVWTLPGKTKVVVHLKDKDKIRHKKRWSQCMYMYYLLGYKLMELPISDERKEVIADNTFLLALDGDIDFQPNAIIRLVDLMKKNKNLGAACGRIHPTGSSFMWAYQMFEYAIGHWMQKATEHVLGCVLCSPGCFSLFRGKALMDDNVMRKYTTIATKAREFVQYDQGEDRWLCTLLLQRGWRVEYSAASDSYTACPETFDEFFNQRRRWMPSTFANILDLLADGRRTVSLNPDISMLYILYQSIIFGGSIVAPGQIFMMINQNLNLVLKISTNEALLYHGLVILGFVIACILLDSKLQLLIAKVLTVAYMMVMMAVLVGLLIQFNDLPLFHPNNMFSVIMFGGFGFAGLMHLQEIKCLPFLIVYYITIPSMYLLLVIYSIANLWNVSWGTREVKEDAKPKTKAELEREKKELEEKKKQAKKDKGGMLDSLMEHLGGKGGDSGNVEFGLSGLFKCMCCTHEDPLEPKKQLVKIASSLEEVSKRINRIESTSSGAGLQFRRRSSLGNKKRSIGSLQEVDEDDNEQESVLIEVQEHESDDQQEEEKIQRDDNKNPYWIEEEEDLGHGPVDYLPGPEQVFFQELIDKYLHPLAKDEKKEKADGEALYELRDTIVFTMLLLNVLFILIISLLLSNKDIIFIPWPTLLANNGTEIIYIPDTNQITVEVLEYQLDPIGISLVLTFGTIMIFQLTAMMFHRWETISHIIATTRFGICEKKAKDVTDDGEVDKMAVDFVKSVQSKQEKREVEPKGGAGRRQTVADLTRFHKKTKGQEGEVVNLETEFRKRFESMDLTSGAEGMDPTLRRLSTRRGTLAALDRRRTSYFGMERRRSTIAARRASTNPSKGYSNDGYDDASDYIDDDFTDTSGASTYRGEGMGRNSDQFDTYTTSQM